MYDLNTIAGHWYALERADHSASANQVARLFRSARSKWKQIYFEKASYFNDMHDLNTIAGYWYALNIHKCISHRMPMPTARFLTDRGWNASYHKCSLWCVNRPYILLGNSLCGVYHVREEYVHMFCHPRKGCSIVVFLRLINSGNSATKSARQIPTTWVRKPLRILR